MNELDELLDECEALDTAATDGPWTASLPSFGFRGVRSSTGAPVCGMPANASHNHEADSKMMADARTLLPRLAAVVQAMAKACEHQPEVNGNDGPCLEINRGVRQRNAQSQSILAAGEKAAKGEK